MKATLHPHLLAALAISAAIFILHSRSFAAAPLRNEIDAPPQAPVVVSLAKTSRVVPSRDPFTAASDETAPSVKSDFNGMDAGPNADAHVDAAGVAAPSSLRLRAVVLGARRYALVADGSSSQIVTIGSPLAGSTVSDITLRGIVLANGARFIPEESAK